MILHSDTQPGNVWHLYVDGASRGNPGHAAVGYVLLRDRVVAHRGGHYIGVATNNYAEYAALIAGLALLHTHYRPGDIVHILADSLLLVQQVLGKYRVKSPGLQPLHAQVMRLLQGLVYTIEHVPRASNAMADSCANEALDRRSALPVPLGYLYVQ